MRHGGALYGILIRAIVTAAILLQPTFSALPSYADPLRSEVEITPRSKAERRAAKQARLARASSSSAVGQGLEILNSLGKSGDPIDPSTPTNPRQLQSSEDGQAGGVPSNPVPEGAIPPPGPGAPEQPPKPEPKPVTPEECLEILSKLVEENKQKSEQESKQAEEKPLGEGGTSAENRAGNSSGNNAGSNNLTKPRGANPSGSFSAPPISNCPDGKCVPSEPPVNRLRKQLTSASLQKGYVDGYGLVEQYLDGDLCKDCTCTDSELELLSTGISAVEKDQEQQDSAATQQPSQGGGGNPLSGLQNLLGGGGGRPQGGAPGAGGAEPGSGLAFGNTPLGVRENYSTAKPETIQELTANPDSVDQLTNAELEELLSEENLENLTPEDLAEICENPKIAERLKEIAEEKKKKEEVASKPIDPKLQEMLDYIANGKAEAAKAKEEDKKVKGFSYLENRTLVAQTGPDGIKHPISQEWQNALDSAIATNGEAIPRGLPHEVSQQKFANSIVQNALAGAGQPVAGHAGEGPGWSTTLAGNNAWGFESFSFQQDAHANHFADRDPANAVKYWNDAAYNVGLTAEAFNQRLTDERWLSTTETRGGTIENFLWHAGYPGAGNTDQGPAGSCWTCPSNSAAYVHRPGELAFKHNEGFQTGYITSVDGKKRYNVSHLISVQPGSQESHFDVNKEPANQRSPLNNIDQQVIAQFGTGGGADRGGNGERARSGLRQYVGLGDTRGSTDSAAFVNGSALSIDAYTPGHISEKRLIPGIDANGQPTRRVTWNNSWGETREVYLPATAANLDSLTLPGGIGSRGFGGGGGGFGNLVGGGGFNPGAGNNNNSVRGPDRDDPLADEETKSKLRDLCYQLEMKGLSEPMICEQFDFVKEPYRGSSCGESMARDPSKSYSSGTPRAAPSPANSSILDAISKRPRIRRSLSPGERF